MRCDEVAVGATAVRTEAPRTTIETVRRLPMRRTVARGRDPHPRRHRCVTGSAYHAAVIEGVDRFRGDVQGLRALAVLAVVLYHTGVPFVAGGYVGVDVFFVISGFLITGHLLRERERTGRVALGPFYARRARRILPASFAVLLASLLAALVWYPPLLLR